MDILYERLMIILCKRLPAAVYSGKIEKNFLFLAEFIYATTMHCILSQLNLFMLIYTIIFWIGREYHNMQRMRRGIGGFMCTGFRDNIPSIL